jgi:hypothetical protein
MLGLDILKKYHEYIKSISTEQLMKELIEAGLENYLIYESENNINEKRIIINNQQKDKSSTNITNTTNISTVFPSKEIQDEVIQIIKDMNK